MQKSKLLLSVLIMILLILLISLELSAGDIPFKGQVVDEDAVDLPGVGDFPIAAGINYNKAPAKILGKPKSDAKLSLDKWTYIGIDSTRKKWGDWNHPQWMRSFGLAMEDITGDGFEDIAAGRYFYRNPGGDMTEKWKRIDFSINADAMLFVDVDDDEYGDIRCVAYEKLCI